MFSINFPTYSRLDALNSLVTKSVHVLCLPVDFLYQRPASDWSSLYDLNILNRFESKNKKAPYRLLQRLYDDYLIRNNQKFSLLDVNSRQAIIDYIIRERISVQAEFVISIIEDGGVYNLNIWQLTEINEFTHEEIDRMLKAMYTFSKCFRQLSLGGASWIYHNPIVNGALKMFLCNNRNLFNVKALRIQHLTSEIDITSLFNSCANLEHLEIAEPSLKNRDMFKMTKHLSSNPDLSICRSLQHITLPSSLQEEGIMHFLAHFPNITHLRCTPFEQLLDLLEHSITNGSSNKLIAEKALKVLSNLRALSIAHPMSRNMVNRLLSNCPQIEELSLELQKYMSLSTLATSAQRLVKLELHNSANQSISFADHVVPILEGCGQQMQVLSLINFDHIDLTKCAQYCPNLRSLSAQCFTTITYQRRLLRWMNVRNPFGNLKHLRLRPRPDYSLPVDICVSLLKNCLNLSHIELYCCLELTDDNIDQINQTNRFERLQTFILRHGHSVTDHALCRLVSCATSLNNLVFHDCGLVPPDIKEIL